MYIRYYCSRVLNVFNYKCDLVGVHLMMCKWNQTFIQINVLFYRKPLQFFAHPENTYKMHCVKLFDLSQAICFYLFILQITVGLLPIL